MNRQRSKLILALLIQASGKVPASEAFRHLRQFRYGLADGAQNQSAQQHTDYQHRQAKDRYGCNIGPENLVDRLDRFFLLGLGRGHPFFPLFSLCMQQIFQLYIQIGGLFLDRQQLFYGVGNAPLGQQLTANFVQRSDYTAYG